MRNSQKGFVVPLIIVISILLIGGTAVYFNKDNILGDSVTQYFGRKLDICIIEENRGNPVSTDIARTVALDQVNKNYPPFNWVSVGFYPIYGSSGEINYYAFVFRKTEYSKFITLNSLEQNASKYSDTTQDVSDKKYQFNDIASVLTGATNGDSPVIRHYRGIPEIVGKKVEIRNYVENKYSDKTVGNIISDSPMGKFYFEIVNKFDNSATGEIIGLDYAIIPRSELTNYQIEVKDRKKKQYMSFDQKQCESYRQALIDRKVELRNQWGKYSQ